MTDLELEAFLEVLRLGSVSKAARSLFVTQPALSRRLQSLEEKLGYPVFVRGKGIRYVKLTEAGERFVPVARRLRALYREAADIGMQPEQPVLQIASVASVSTYLLPEVMREFCACRPDVRLNFHHYHSLEAYQYMEEGMLELALISDDMYSKTVETLPLFREPMVLVYGKKDAAEKPVRPEELDPAGEIRLPWNPEYDAWHDYWFRKGAGCRVGLDQMSLLEYFLSVDERWAIVPYSVACFLGERVFVNRLQDGPPDRIIYYLRRPGAQMQEAELFLELVRDKLKKLGEEIRIYH